MSVESITQEIVESYHANTTMHSVIDKFSLDDCLDSISRRAALVKEMHPDGKYLNVRDFLIQTAAICMDGVLSIDNKEAI